MSQTYQPSKIKRARTHGFLKRKSSASGRKIILNRIRKGRKHTTVSSKKSKR